MDRKFISKQNIKINCSDIHLFVQLLSHISFLISFFVIKCLPIFRHSISPVPRGVPRVRWDFVFENENYIELYNHWGPIFLCIISVSLYKCMGLIFHHLWKNIFTHFWHNFYVSRAFVVKEIWYDPDFKWVWGAVWCTRRLSTKTLLLFIFASILGYTKHLCGHVRPPKYFVLL